MTRPSDLHWSLLDERAFRVVRETVESVRSLRGDYLLAGGWAVDAHAPVVPSVDCDLYLRGAPGTELEADLRGRGLTLGPQAEVEFLRLDEPAEFLGFGDSLLLATDPARRDFLGLVGFWTHPRGPRDAPGGTSPRGRLRGRPRGAGGSRTALDVAAGDARVTPRRWWTPRP